MDVLEKGSSIALSGYKITVNAVAPTHASVVIVNAAGASVQTVLRAQKIGRSMALQTGLLLTDDRSIIDR